MPIRKNALSGAASWSLRYLCLRPFGVVATGRPQRAESWTEFDCRIAGQRWHSSKGFDIAAARAVSAEDARGPDVSTPGPLPDKRQLLLCVRSCRMCQEVGEAGDRAEAAVRGDLIEVHTAREAHGTLRWNDLPFHAYSLVVGVDVACSQEPVPRQVTGQLRCQVLDAIMPL